MGNSAESGVPALRASRLFLAFSAICFVLCLSQPTFYQHHDDGTVPGSWLLLLGWMHLGYAAREGWFTAFAWLANPLLAASWGFTLCRKQWSVYLCALALLLAGSFQFARLVYNRGGVDDIVGLGAGYWLWLASIAFAFIAALLLWSRAPTIPRRPRMRGLACLSTAIVAGLYLAGGFRSQRDDLEIDSPSVRVSLLAGSSTFVPGGPTSKHPQGNGREAWFFALKYLSLLPDGDIFESGSGYRITTEGVVSQQPLSIDPPGTPFELTRRLGPMAPVVSDARGQRWMLASTQLPNQPSEMALVSIDEQGHGTVHPTEWPGHDNTFAGLAVDREGNFYTAHGWYDSTIVKLTPNGVMTVLVGDQGKGPFSGPSSLWFDSTGTLFVCDNGNNAISTVDANARVHTFLRLQADFHLKDCTQGLDGQLYIVGWQNGNSQLFRLDDTRQPKLIVEIPSGIGNLLVDRTGVLYASVGGGILKIQPKNAKQNGLVDSRH